MNERDLMFLARVVLDDGYNNLPYQGEASAAERCRSAGLVDRDPTAKTKPFRYVATEKGRAFIAATVSALEAQRGTTE